MWVYVIHLKQDILFLICHCKLRDQMKFNHVKLLFLFISIGLIPAHSFGEVVDVSTIKCNIPGCVVTCFFQETREAQIVDIDSLKVILYSNGLTKLELDKGMNGMESILVGPKSYMCSIDNQKAK